MKLSTSHATHKESLWRFVALLILLASYFAYMSYKFDAATGAWLAALSWSFFVLCTPVADGGFIIAFPVRVLLGARMVVTQIIVWFIAIGINIMALTFSPESYAGTTLTRLLNTILITPWPYWSILIISIIGTMLSIWFADEMIDVAAHEKRQKHHKHSFKHKTLIVLGLGILAILAYYHILSDLDVNIAK